MGTQHQTNITKIDLNSTLRQITFNELTGNI